MKYLVASVLFFLAVVPASAQTGPAKAQPDTVSALRARAHDEIGRRDATIEALQGKLAAQVKQIVWLQEQVRDLCAKAQAAASPAPVDAPAPITDTPPHPFLTPIQQATADAVNAHLVNVTANVSVVFNHSAEVEFTVENLSRRPIQFYTTPAMWYGIDLRSDLRVRLASTIPIPSAADQQASIFANALAGGQGVVSGTMTLPGEPPTLQNTVIAPGGTLYFRASGNVYGHDFTPTKFTFKGGGWDDYALIVRAVPANDFGR